MEILDNRSTVVGWKRTATNAKREGENPSLALFVHNRIETEAWDEECRFYHLTIASTALAEECDTRVG